MLYEYNFLIFDLIFCVFNATFSNISVLVVEEAGVPTMDKQLVNFIACGCESRASFL
jgi:hypothetical protein